MQNEKTKNEYFAGEIDVAVIGAGHAGCEAALASARLGMSTVLFTLCLDAVANLPCNPSIGGSGKGHLVCELDALGGQMGRTADEVMLQSRILNQTKGVAVHSLRQQTDRRKYQLAMKKVLENTDNLLLKQAEITEVRVENGHVKSVVTKLGAVYSVKAVIVSTGTYLDSTIIIGDVFYSGGPDGSHAAVGLTESLKAAGVKIMRFKTGTPSRVHKDSIDTSVLQIQEGDAEPQYFSYYTDKSKVRTQLPCYVTYTNEQTHDIIRSNLHRSPLYSGKIKGVGPRYCPSIEDKVVRFAEKERHQLFIEPCGEDTKEMYIQGFSSSLPEDVQLQMIHSLKGLENARVMRTAYAIEYDCCDPTQLYPTLEFKDIKGLYGAGQFNGTSGYEEAACQGLVAGINASMSILGRESLVLSRGSSYIGTLIDDLVTKGTNEPYRIMTSRCEYRLLLRQDNAEERLCKIGYDIGLVEKERYEYVLARCEAIQKEIKRISKIVVPPSETANEIMRKKNSTELDTGIHLNDLIKRPEISYDDTLTLDPERPSLPKEITSRVQTEIKYAGYIAKELAEIERVKKLESKKIPEDFDYDKVVGLRLEATQKLKAIRPINIGQATRISGVSPADITVLLVYVEMRNKNGQGSV